MDYFPTDGGTPVNAPRSPAAAPSPTAGVPTAGNPGPMPPGAAIVTPREPAPAANGVPANVDGDLMRTDVSAEQAAANYLKAFLPQDVGSERRVVTTLLRVLLAERRRG